MVLSNYFNYLKIPDTWSSLREFGNWYMAQKMPIRIPEDSAVFNTGQVTSFVSFRQDVYQVELYVVNPNIKAAEHYHPDIELFMCQIGAMNSNCALGTMGPVLNIGESHGAEFKSDKGAVFLTFEKWNPQVKMTSASVNWKGKTDGALHDSLIRQYYPNAYIKDGYADITRNMND